MLYHNIFRLLVICMVIASNYVEMSFAATFEIPPAPDIPSHIIEAEVGENQPIGTEVVRIGVNNPEGSTLHFRFFFGFYFFDHEYDGSELIIKTNMILDYEYLENELFELLPDNAEDLTPGFFTSIGVWSDPEQDADDSTVITISILNDPSDDDDPLNNYPEFTDGEELTITVPQGTAAGENIGSPIIATDDDGDKLTYKLYTSFLSSSFNSQFTIDSTTGQLQTVISLDEAGSETLYLYVVDGKGGYDLFYATINIETQEVETQEPSQQQTAQMREDEQGTKEDTNNEQSRTSRLQATQKRVSDTQTKDDNEDNPDEIATVKAEDNNPETQAENADGSEPETQPEKAVESQTETQTEKVVESEPDAQTEKVVESEPDAQTEKVVESEPETPSDMVIESEDAQTEKVVENEPETQTEKVVESQPNTLSENADGSEPETQIENAEESDLTSALEESNPVGSSSQSGDLLFALGQIGFSEIMYASRGGLHSDPQWIELYNNSTEQLNLKGWQLKIEAKDANGSHRHVIITLESLSILPQKTVLIVTWLGRSSKEIAAGSVYNFFNHHSDAFEQNRHRNMVVGQVGFFLELSDPDGSVSDVVGNLDGEISTQDEPAWELPNGFTENGFRASLMRRYSINENLPRDGKNKANWVLSSNLPLSVLRFWGKTTDFGNPGHRIAAPLPVELSSFIAEKTDAGVAIRWTTESEIDNAGFNILRSDRPNGPFRIINSKLIQGAGTTGERKTYTWIDTTSRPHIEYYYQIEDISFAGIRQTLSTKRMKGVFSAVNRVRTLWGDLKMAH